MEYRIFSDEKMNHFSHLSQGYVFDDSEKIRYDIDEYYIARMKARIPVINPDYDEWHVEKKIEFGKIVTVGDLISALEQMPKDLPVIDCGEQPGFLELVRNYYKGDYGRCDGKPLDENLFVDVVYLE